MAQYSRSAQTKEVILESACSLFYEKGYTEATVRQICARSGLSVSRINYHFSSKAELAEVICDQFFQNFIQQLRLIMGTLGAYSVVNEAIALRFLVRLLLADPALEPSARFYRELAREGILTEVFSVIDEHIFSEESRATAVVGAVLRPGQREVCSRIYAAALPGVIQSWDRVLETCGGDRENALKLLQDVFVSLFMQMLDYDHRIQQRVLALSQAYYACMEVEVLSLTAVRIHINGPLPQMEEAAVVV